MMKIFGRRDGTAAGNGEEEYTWRDGVYLTTVNDSLQADILVSKLDAEGIPSEKKYVGSSHFLEITFGTNVVGDIEIYVPSECLEDAKNIIVPVDLDECIQDDVPGTEED